jgi:hypothetical protein
LLTLGAGAGFGILNGGAAGATTPTTFTVNDAGDGTNVATGCTSSPEVDCTLRDAIDAANAAGVDTTIELPNPNDVANNPAAFYTVSSSNGQLDFNSNTSGVTITLEPTGGADQSTNVIKAVQAPTCMTDTDCTRVLKVDIGTTADISGVTIEGGHPNGGVGGGILNCGNLNLSDSTVTGNQTADTGGGIEIDQPSGGTTTLDDVNVNANTTGGQEFEGYFVSGGGIDILGVGEETTTTTISDSQIDGNTSDDGDGGGIEISGADNDSNAVTIENSDISGNSVGGEDSAGGGLSQDSDSTLNVTNSTITDNASLPDSFVYGGGVSLDMDDPSPGAITDDSIIGNQADDGGGVGIGTGSTIENSTISGNVANDSGGGVYVGTGGNGPTTISGSTITGNTALNNDDDVVSGDGGGVMSEGNTTDGGPLLCNAISLTNDTIVGNTADVDGGGYVAELCSNNNGAPVPVVKGALPHPALRTHNVRAHISEESSSYIAAFLFDTINGNSAGDRAGGGNIEVDDSSTATLADSIVAGGTAASDAQRSKVTAKTASTVPANCEFDGDQTFTSGGYNLIDDSTCGTPGTGDIIGQSPQLGALGNNGGPTQTELPASTSPAIGAVPTASCDGITTDQRGQARPQGQNNTCTIGSVEVSNVVPPPTNFNGYRLAAKDGGAFDFGIQFGGSLANQRLNAPIVGLANEPGPYGYLMVGSDGGVFSFGGARFFGSLGGQKLASPISGIATTPDGGGYWLVSQAGTVYNFGDAPPLAALSGVNKPIVGIATDLSGKGAWLVGSDGGVFALGDAPFEGSLGNLHLNAPIVGIAPSPSGNGYVLAASDGGVFAFPNALYHGSAATIHLNAPVVGIAETHSGNGYWLVASDGGVFTYGDAPFLGSMGAIALNAPIVGIQHLGAGATG